MTTRLIIARHGNTFTKEQTPTRVGANTDLPLVENERGNAIGRYLLKLGINIDAVYCGPLKRHIQTAELACEALEFDTSAIQVKHNFNEIDYGPDEDKTEEQVMLRLGNGDLKAGELIIEKWNREAIAPPGWQVDVEALKQSWLDFSQSIATEHPNQNVLLVSSNGTIRFAPVITGDFEGFIAEHDIKVTTGGICIFEKEDDEANWRCVEWGVKPLKHI
ncbi:histidine phosphatase family protein [Paraneptunicella aestuarii]|uniref:histidine phosphatase family protein n=1 Tax=Paraneptunicella aestuarii TaxID=2831148 RepID=UPI001E5E75DE|nr:histidine phosphatase family protein [Paraneptunicella aestuarii]UAA38593.1 histidine phosphatase family protein [Paraneptunicella aestuarii]